MLVGLGNRLRGDDGAGPEVARLVRRRAPAVRAIEHEREPTDLLELWPGSPLAIVVDAVAGSRPGRVHRVDACRTPLPAGFGERGSTHLLGLAEVVELGRSLGRLPGRLVVFGIEAQEFSLGAGLSPRVEAAVEAVATAALAELAAPGDEPAAPSGAR
jgi:hydrogenase maturation protease